MQMHPLYAAAVAGCLGMIPTPALAQTVILPDPPPARADSARPPAVRGDTTRASPAPVPTTPPPPAPVPAPAAPPAADALPRGICADALPGEAAPDVLGIVFQSDATPEARDAALAAVAGKRLAGSAEDQFQYVHVPAGGSEFRLRTLADKLIRLRSVSEVGPVACPAQPARPDSTSS
jgi:hypothetical protein